MTAPTVPADYSDGDHIDSVEYNKLLLALRVLAGLAPGQTAIELGVELVAPSFSFSSTAAAYISNGSTEDEAVPSTAGAGELKFAQLALPGPGVWRCVLENAYIDCESGTWNNTIFYPMIVEGIDWEAGGIETAVGPTFRGRSNDNVPLICSLIYVNENTSAVEEDLTVVSAWAFRALVNLVGSPDAPDAFVTARFSAYRIAELEP